MKVVSEEQIKAWKQKYDGVFELKVEDKVCYVKSPDRKTLSYATVAGQKDPLKFNEVLLENCWLDGDEEIKTNDSLFMSVSGQLAEIIELKEATIKKL